MLLARTGARGGESSGAFKDAASAAVGVYPSVAYGTPALKEVPARATLRRGVIRDDDREAHRGRHSKVVTPLERISSPLQSSYVDRLAELENRRE